MSDDYLIIRLTDGEKEVSLVDNENFSLEPGGWAPAIATRRISQLGGYGVYEDVKEQLTLNVYGNTPAQVLKNLQVLIELLDQADAWSLGHYVKPVLFQVKVQGSEFEEPLETKVLGRVSRDAPLIVNPPTFHDALALWGIGPITISFLRDGLWYGEVVSSTSLPHDNPAIFEIDLLDETDVPSPTTVMIDGYKGGASMHGGGIIALTGVPRQSLFGTNLGIFLPASMNPTGFSITDDAANLAKDDDVMRINAANDQTGTLTIPNVYADAAIVGVFANVRNNSTTPWRIRAKSSGFVVSGDRWKDILGEQGDPQVIFVGTLSNHAGSHINVSIEVATDENTGTLDVNYIAIFPYGTSSQHISLIEGDYSTTGNNRVLVIDPQTLTHRTPNVYIGPSETEGA